MAGLEMPLELLLEHLQRLAEKSLSLWDIPRGATATLINVSENVTYRIDAAGGYRAILRVHRKDYHTRHAIACELAWLKALQDDGVVKTHHCYPGCDGCAIQSGEIDGLDGARFLVLFSFLEGTAPDESGDMTSGFTELGAMAARCHRHVTAWQKPEDFERLVWDAEAVFGPDPTWGDWRAAPGVTALVRDVLERVESKIRSRLKSFGKPPERFNLIHADMRLANLLVDGTATQLIDFDDCGYGWFLYDFAAAISFIEDDPRIPDFKKAWLCGYRSVRALPERDEAEMDTFIMLRRMALLAWIGSHIEAPEPQALAPGFAAATARLGETYLRDETAL